MKIRDKRVIEKLTSNLDEAGDDIIASLTENLRTHDPVTVLYTTISAAMGMLYSIDLDLAEEVMRIYGQIHREGVILSRNGAGAEAFNNHYTKHPLLEDAREVAQKLRMRMAAKMGGQA